MSSPYATGGGGTQFEARVVAAYMAAALCEAPSRGLQGDHTVIVHTQRADFGHDLDDVIVEGQHADGRPTQLHLQIKNRLTFTAKDADWIDVVQRAWDTFSKPGFDAAAQRLGAGIGVYSARADQHYQSVLTWAQHSADAADFFARLGKRKFSHADMQTFVADMRAILDAHAGRAPSDDEVWRFLRTFVILHFDLQTTGSRDAASATERLKGLLAPGDRATAVDVWNHLVATAGVLVPTGGGASRASMLHGLAAAGFTIGAAPSWVDAIGALQRDSERALADISTTMRGVHIHRSGAHEALAAALDDGRFVQIDGEPGAGKSALLKQVALQAARSGPVLVFKDGRIHPRGWAAHARAVGASDDLVGLLREFGCAGEPILFIDGIDKLTDPEIRATVNDLVRAVANNEGLDRWRVLVTTREQNLDHLKAWLDPEAMARLPLRTVAVGPFDERELSAVADAFPALRPLLFQRGSLDVVLKRPFFLDALLGLTGSRQRGSLPASEVELLRLWWRLGGADRGDGAAAQRRRNAILGLARAVLAKPGAPVGIGDFDPDALEDLKSSGVLRDRRFGHTVAFAHDVFEEWALCEILVGNGSGLDSFLRTNGEPDLLVRPVQLYGAFLLETGEDAEEWKAVLAETADPTLRPVWQRAVFTACLQSTRTTLLLGRIEGFLLENDAERLRRLLAALATLEVVPNPVFLDESVRPNLSGAQRSTYANLSAIPRIAVWIRFLDWLLPLAPKLPVTVVPEMLRVFKTWQDAFAGGGLRHGAPIAALAFDWLAEIEGDLSPGKWSAVPQLPGDAALGREVEKAVRALALSSAGDAPDRATAYLGAEAAGRRIHVHRLEIVANSGAAARHVPSALVAYMLRAFREDLDAHDPFGRSWIMDRDLGIAGHLEFNPASPFRLPFLPLLHTDADEGLRLVGGLCNHAIEAWRRLHGVDRGGGPATPVPVVVEFQWGLQTFWGDTEVYRWFRGASCGPVVASALMALELWALERLDAGASFEEVFHQIVGGNATVAALGVGVSLCLAKPGASPDIALALVTCPRLWNWDIERMAQERTRANEIGDWRRHGPLLEAVRALNDRPHRQSDLRSLCPLFVFSTDQDLVRVYTERVRAFPSNPPLAYAEDAQDKDLLEALRRQMTLYSEQADPRHWKREPTDGGHFLVWSEPPSLAGQGHAAQERALELQNERLGIALWAQKSLETDGSDVGVSLAEAIVKARSWDEEDVFDPSNGPGFEIAPLAGAVAGVACMAALQCDDVEWTQTLAAWCLDVAARAAGAPEAQPDVMVRDAVFFMTPAVFAARAFAAMMARGHEVATCQTALLQLAVDPLQAVQSAVVAGVATCARDHVDFAWALFDLMLRQCIVPRDAIPDQHAVVWDAVEAGRQTALADRAEASLRSPGTPALPAIPLSWVFTGEPKPPFGWDTKGWGRSEEVFLHHLAGGILPMFPLAAFLEDQPRRAEVMALAGGLLDYTFQEMVPPFASSVRRNRGDVPYEWVSELASWCGTLCSHLTGAEGREAVLAPILARDNATALLLMQGLMRSFMVQAILREDAIDEGHFALWEEMFGWVLDNPEWRQRQDHDLDDGFAACALLTLFCVEQGFAAPFCGMRPDWPLIGRFEPLLRRAIVRFGPNATLYRGVLALFERCGADLMPEPGLSCLRVIVMDRRDDRPFWAGNGESTVEILNRAISAKGGDMEPDATAKIIAIADVLVENGVRGAHILHQELLRSKRS